MYHRTLTFPNHSFFLFGPRATGKSTWLREKLPSALWFNLLLDSELISLLGDSAIFRAKVDALKDGSWVVVDEVQKAPMLLNHIQDLIALRGDSIRFALSGSSARKLRRMEVNLLAGRVIERKFFPLTFSELAGQYSVDSALARGLLPGIVDSKDYGHEMLEAYVAMYLREEIRQEALVKDIGSFARFLKVAAILNGQLLSISNVARDCGVARSTVERYFEILVDTLIAVLLPAWQPGAKVREVTQPRLYLFDCGVVRALQGRIRDPLHDSDLGSLFETLILHELRAAISYLNCGGELFHWRTSGGSEVDFVWQRGDRAIGFEVKASKSWRREYGKSLRPLVASRKLSRGIVIYRGQDPTADQAIEGIPVVQFLDDLWRGKILG